MNVTQVSLIPAEGSKNAGRPALTPELLAATGARYSRNNEGLEAILAKIDWDNVDKSVDNIFKFVDYGHASLMDLAPVALFMDDISMYLAYYIWSICPTAGGQESSTRYIKISPESLPTPEEIGLDVDLAESYLGSTQSIYLGSTQSMFKDYQAALDIWTDLAKAKPEIMRIPQSLIDDSSSKAQKQVDRMRRNYAFDRARYYLPFAAKTNVMMVQSARAWCGLASHLQSHPLPEFRALGARIAEELSLATPRLTKHTKAQESTRGVLMEEFNFWQEMASESGSLTGKDIPFLDIMGPRFSDSGRFTRALSSRTNRYSLVGSSISRMSVTFGWEAIAMAEIRDLNRHRTGTKWCPLVPQGFYGAVDEIPDHATPAQREALETMARRAEDFLFGQVEPMITQGIWAFPYFTLLGTTYPFEHTTTADKFLYEMELRTGLGAHYRYAKHCRDVLQLWYKEMPMTQGLVLEGTAEPE